MSYKDLYRYIQEQPSPIDLQIVRQKIADLLPGRRVQIRSSSMDPNKLLGYYVSSRNADAAFYAGLPAGAAVIVIGGSLDEKWARYVQLKELMHLFDDPLQATTTAEELASLLSGLCDSVIGKSITPQATSEYICMWMAIGLLCPELKRVELQNRRDARDISDIELSEELMCPARMIPALFSPNYKTIITEIIEDSE